MEHVLGNLPPEVHWSIMKYMRHPVAELFHNAEDARNSVWALDAHLDEAWFSDIFFIMHEARQRERFRLKGMIRLQCNGTRLRELTT
jgi:hypothetical protein